MIDDHRGEARFFLFPKIRNMPSVVFTRTGDHQRSPNSETELSDQLANGPTHTRPAIPFSKNSLGEREEKMNNLRILTQRASKVSAELLCVFIALIVCRPLSFCGFQQKEHPACSSISGSCAMPIGHAPNLSTQLPCNCTCCCTHPYVCAGVSLSVVSGCL